MKNSRSNKTSVFPRTSPGEPCPSGEQENVPAKDGTTVPERAQPTVPDRAKTAVQHRAQPTVPDRAKTTVQHRAYSKVRASPPPPVQASASTSVLIPAETELRGKDEDVLTWFARSIAKPSKEEFGEMLRWTRKTIVDEGVLEYQLRWLEKARPILNKLDRLPRITFPLRVKRTMLLLVAADYLHKPRNQVFELPGVAGRTAYERWMRRPDMAAVYHEVYALMETEVLEHELAEIRKATRITRISAGRAAEVRADLLENPNPWVVLQSARDIMQSADRQTAAKGTSNTSINISGQLSTEQIDQLLERAGEELHSWSQSQVQAPASRPVVILDQPQDEEETAVPK